jgi:replicative DNA helicase
VQPVSDDFAIRYEGDALGAAMVASPAAEAITGALSPADFSRPAHRAIFIAIKDLTARASPVNAMTVAEQLLTTGDLEAAGGRDAVALLAARCPAPGNADFYAAKIREAAAGRAVKTIAQRLATAQGVNGEVTAARDDLSQLIEQAHPAPDQAQSGGTFIFDAPADVPAIWGNDTQVLWSEGEPMLLAGPPGVGKTTLAHQLTLARIGARERVLEHDVMGVSKRVLYVAADRPAQIARSFRRMVTEEDRALLDRWLLVWKGALPFDLGREPERLVPFLRERDVGTVVLDSLSNCAMDLVKDDAAARVNHAMQAAAAAGIEVMALHHLRKGEGDGRPRKLADLYGSTWLATGAGSVLLLWGEAGDPVVEMRQLKQPADEVGPMDLVHDHDTGTTTIYEAPDLLTMVRDAPAGLTAPDAARVLFGNDEKAAVEKARRRLRGLVRKGLLHERVAEAPHPVRWVLVEANRG